MGKGGQLIAQAKENAREAAERWEKALEEPTLDAAIAAYGRAEASFWSAAKRRGEATAVRRRYAACLAKRAQANREASRSSRAKNRAAYDKRRKEAFVEDAEFLARHGETAPRAAERLGMKSWDSAYMRLNRYGRLDIADRLLANTDGVGTGRLPRGRVIDDRRMYRP